MTNSLQSALINFKNAAYDLHEQWVAEGETFILNKDYPFTIDFAQVVSDISDWADSSVEKLKEVHISDDTLELTGGGVLVHYLTIENSGDLKMIGISRECIVGYNLPYFEATGDEDTLWIINVGDWSNIMTVRNELNEKFPTIADELITSLIKHFGYNILQDYDGDEALFVSDSTMSISNVFIDDTGRYAVEPIAYYGLDKIVEALSKLN